MIELNLRLDVRWKSHTPEAIAQRHEQALALLGDVEFRRHDVLVDGVRVPRLVVAVEDWSENDLYDLAEQLDQDCIAAFDVPTGRGLLIGPRTEAYGPFDRARFERLKVHAPAVDPAKGNALLKKLLGTKLPIVQDSQEPP